MTIEIWIRFDDLELLKTAMAGHVFHIKNHTIKYSTYANVSVASQHCVHIEYNKFVEMIDNQILIKL